MQALIAADAVLLMRSRGHVAAQRVLLISERTLRAALRGTRAVATGRPTAILRFPSGAEKTPGYKPGVSS